MTKVFRILSFVIAALVVVQAAAIAWAFFGLWKWIDAGNTLDSAAVEGDESPFAEAAGFMIHGINGTMLIPLLAIALLVVGLIAKFPGSTKWGGIVFLFVLVQVLLAFAGFGAPVLGALHGLNALLLFAAAAMAGVKAKDVQVTEGKDSRTHVDA